MSDIILEALRKLKTLNEEVDDTLYANYVDSLPVFIDVLKNKRILTNYVQWKRGRDFDTRGNHICLTTDLINPPKIMPGCQFGIALDKEKLNTLVKEKAKTNQVRSVGSFITDEPKEDNYIDVHQDSRYRRYMNKILNKVKNKSQGMAVIAIYETTSGDKFIHFHGWTWRDFLVADDPEIIKASNSLFNNLEKAFEKLYDTQKHDSIKDFNRIYSCIRLGDNKRTEYDKDIESKYFPDLYVNNPSFKSGYCIGIQNEFGARGNHTANIAFNSVPIRLESTFDENNYREDSVINIEGVGEIPLSENEMFALDSSILDEHEFRLYTAEVKQNDHTKATIKKKTDFEKIPNAFFTFETSDIIRRIFVPDSYRVNKSEEKTNPTGSDYIMIDFYNLFMDVANNSLKALKNIGELKTMLYNRGIEKESTKSNWSSHNYKDEDIKRITDLGIDLNDLYRFIVYTDVGAFRKTAFSTNADTKGQGIIKSIDILNKTIYQIEELQQLLKTEYNINDWKNDLYWYRVSKTGDNRSIRLGKTSSEYMFKQELNR